MQIIYYKVNYQLNWRLKSNEWWEVRQNVTLLHNEHIANTSNDE